jgi:hypothetical protein
MRKNRKPFNCNMDKINDLVSVILQTPIRENHGSSMSASVSRYAAEILIKRK